jgi:acetylornithine deacetylase
MNKQLYQSAIELLQELIETPSFSGEEDHTAILIEKWFSKFDIISNRSNNNIWATIKHFDNTKPTILLNSHHDTVKPNKAYINNPFDAKIIEDKLFGLGSNDAGGCLVSLMSTFLNFYEKENLNYNLVIACTGEEEDSGPNGLNNLLSELPTIEFAIVGEPTEMNLAIAEKGLLVIDANTTGVSGHAAHDNTENAIYNAMEDINWIQNYKFPLLSDTLGKVKMSVTQINAGEQHNVVPATCHFVIDVRINEHYSNKEIFELINNNTKSKLDARSFGLNSSSIQIEHPIVQAGLKLERTTYGSPTLSDQSVLNCPSLKMGPGLSTRSHSADEFIYLKEIEDGIQIYINLLNEILL